MSCFELRPGTLYMCATPLGNLSDLSPRAGDALAAADVIAAERPSHTRKLLSHLGIPSSKLRPCGESTTDAGLNSILDVLDHGGSVVMVSDAGTPGISDPGSRLVDMAVRAGWPVLPIPGPSALSAALSVCGFDTRRVLMEGFLPRKSGAKRVALEKALSAEACVVLFESPKRVLATLETLAELDDQRQIMVLREATKLHEETIRGAASEVAAAMGPSPRGEFTMVIAPPGEAVEDDCANGEFERGADRLLAEGLSARDAVRALMVLSGLSKSRAFDIVKAAKSAREALMEDS